MQIFWTKFKLITFELFFNSKQPLVGWTTKRNSCHSPLQMSVQYKLVYSVLMLAHEGHTRSLYRVKCYRTTRRISLCRLLGADTSPLLRKPIFLSVLWGRVKWQPWSVFQWSNSFLKYKFSVSFYLTSIITSKFKFHLLTRVHSSHCPSFPFSGTGKTNKQTKQNQPTKEQQQQQNQKYYFITQDGRMWNHEISLARG